MPKLDTTLFDQIVDVLSPHMGTSNARQEKLVPLFNNKPIYAHIEWEGTAREFTTKLVMKLSHQELTDLLRRLSVGEEQKPQLDALCSLILADPPSKENTPQGTRNNNKDTNFDHESEKQVEKPRSPKTDNSNRPLHLIAPNSTSQSSRTIPEGLQTPDQSSILPKALIEQVRDGRAVVFIGRGAVRDATNKSRKKLPNFDEVKNDIITKFLDSTYNDYPIDQVIELAISEHDTRTIYEHIVSVYQDFYPASYHQLIAGFVWQSIITTNFDLVIERAYAAAKEKVQRPVIFKKNGERVEEKLRDPSSVVLMKLHGCITDITDELAPLVFSSDLYHHAQSQRSRLFERVQNLAYEFPFLIIGNSLADDDVRSILRLIAQIPIRPRSYIIASNMTPVETRLWEGQRFSCINMTFKDFLEELNNSIPKGLRAVANLNLPSEHPISKHFVSSELPSSRLLKFLVNDIDYVHRDYKTSKLDPKTFYGGYFDDLTPIILNLDVRRGMIDSILSEVFLVNEAGKADKAEFYLIKGHAGSGKSVLARRLAWDAAVDFDKLCLIVNHTRLIDYEVISELYRLVQNRIFLFIDPLSQYIDSVEALITEARKDKLPLTIIGAERANVWNTNCTVLEPFLTDSYEVPYLNEQEINELLGLLTRHKCLGHLEGLSFEEQKQALSKRAERQLLVALHEATLGKPFREIVLDEFNAISSIKAKSLYLTTCIFHRIGVNVRAGLISRVHRIPFTMFEHDLFRPLESIVFAHFDDSMRDYVYRSRHSHIAEIVFEEVLREDNARFAEYVRLLNSIDIDYDSDYAVFKGLTNARQLLDLFDEANLIEQIYEIAQSRVGEHAKLMQQMAIFEMNRQDGDLDKAAEWLQRANKLAPSDKPILHSLSVLARKKSHVAPTDLEKDKYREEAKSVARRLIQDRNVTAHAFNTLIEIEIDELQEMIDSSDERTLEKKVREIEQQIIRTRQIFPDESYILEQESKFNSILGNHLHAVASLERAFSKNKKNVYIALRLAKMHESRGNPERAISILRECIELNPDDKDINYNLASILMRQDESRTSEIKYYLRRGFTVGDSNHMAQFLYARLLYLNGEFDEASNLFSTLTSANIDNRTKQKPREKVISSGNPVKYSGTVAMLEASYAFIKSDKYQNDIFTHKSYNNKYQWENLKSHDRVVFELSFTYKGPVALNIVRES